MANPYGFYGTNGTLGANFKQTYVPETTNPYQAGPPFALGQNVLGTDNSVWVFVRSNIVVGANIGVVIDANFNITNTGATHTTGAPFAIGDFGWIRKTPSPF